MRFLSAIIFLLISSEAIFSQPANDNCATAIALGTLPTPTNCPSGAGTQVSRTGTLVAATSGNPYIFQTGCTGAGGANMGVPANDVWYSFVASGYEAIITVNSTFANPNIAMYAGTCASLGGGVGGCSVGTGGTVTLTVEQMVIGTTYYIQVSGNTGQSGTFNINVQNNKGCNDCLVSTTLTVSPLPVNGMYTPGQTVHFCYHINSYAEINTNWLHGIQITLGAGWNPATLVASPVTTYSCGTWNYYPGGIVDPFGQTWPRGFYFDRTCAPLGGGTSGDGNPGNNFGDNITPNIFGNQNIWTIPANIWNFCFDVTVANGCAPGSDLGITFNTSGDGESGTWTNLGCVSDPPTDFNAVGSCCPPVMSTTPITCLGNNGTATATPVGNSGPYNYSWANSGGTVVSTTNGVAGANTISGLTPGTYTVSITNVLNCLVTNTVTVTGPGTIATPTASSNSPVCAGVTLNLNAANVVAASYSWTGPNGFSSLTQNPSITNVTVAASGTYTVTATVGICTNTSTVTVTVNPIPVVTVPSNIVVCKGVNVTASNFTSTVPGTTFAWTNSNTTIGLAGSGTGNTPSFTAINNTALPVTSTITVTPTANGCPGTPVSYTITVNPTPVVVVSANIIVCRGSTVAASNFTSTTPGTTFAWTNTNTSIGLAASGTGNTPSFTGTNSTSFPSVATVTVTPTANGCPGTPVSYTITVNPIPVVVVPANVTVCNGANVVAGVFTSTTPGATFAWTNSNTTIGLAGSGTGNTLSFTAINNTAIPVTSTITVTPTANGCPGTPVSYTITVNPTPVVVVPANVTVCNGANVAAGVFSSTTPGTTFAWTNSTPSIGLAASGTGNTPSFTGTNNTANPVTATVTVTPSANGCPGTPVSYTITVNPIPVVTVPSNIVVCRGVNVTASNFTSTTPGTTFAWTNSTPSIGLAVSGTGNTPSFTGTNNTANPVTATINVTPTANGCPGTPVSYTITVNPIPVVVAPANVTVCNGANVAAGVFSSTTPGTTFAWTNSTPSIGLAANGTGNTPSFNTVNNSALPVTATITVTPTANGCPGAPVSYTITVNPTPVVVVPATVIVCNGATVAAGVFSSTTPGTTFAWTNSTPSIGLAASGTGNTPSFTGTNNTANPVTATVTVTPTANGCPGTPVSYTITVNPIPVVVVPSNLIVCNGANVAAGVFTSTTPGATFSWTNSNTTIGLAAIGTGNTPSFTGTNSTANPVTATVTVTPTANGCPGAPVSYTITVNPTPVVVVPANVTVCNGANVAAGVFSSTTPGTTFAWTNSTPSIGLAASGTGNTPSFTGTNNTANPVTATVTVTPSANGCPGTPVSYTITVNPTPIVVVPANITVCNGANVAAGMFTSTTPGTMFAWANPTPSIGLVSSGTGNIPSFTGTNNTANPVTATVTVTPTANGCPGAPVSYTITVNPTPVVVIPANVIVCNGANVATGVFSSTTPGTTFAWANSNSTIGLAASGTGNTPSFTGTNNTALPVTAIVTVTPSANGCPGTPSTYSITVNPTPVVVVPADITVCNATTVAISNFTSSTPGTTFAWTNSNTTIGLASGGTGNTPSFTGINNTALPVTATITITPTANGCPGVPITYTITVNPGPNVTVPANITVCNGATIAASNFTSTTPGATFSWTNSDASIGLASSGTGNIPPFTGTNNTSFPVTTTITVTPSASGCPGTPASYSITVNPTPIVVVPANVTACNGANVATGVFSSTTPGTTFAWANTNTTIGLAASGTGNTPSFTGTNNTANPVTATVTVTPTANGCPGTPVSYTITVNPTPVVAIPANIIVCNATAVAVSNFTSSTPGTTFAWTNSNTTIGLAGSGTGNTPSFTAINNTALPVTSTITVTPNANGCPGTPVSYTITVNPTPVVVVPANVTVCNGANVAAGVFTSTTPGTTFAWTNSTPSIGLAVSGTGNTPSFTGTNNTANPVTATVTVSPTANGCPGTPVSYTITVNPTPVVVVPANIIVCNATTVAISAFTSTTPGTTFVWVNSDPTIGLTANGTGNTPSFTAVNNTALSVTATVTVTPTANGCPGLSIPYTITVNPTPVITLPADIVVCNGATVAASAYTSPTPGVTFAWINSDPSIGLAANGAGNTPSFTATNNTALPVTATITATANGCPGIPGTYTITVNPTPVVAVPADITVCNAITVAASNFTSTTPGTIFAWTNSDPSIGLAVSGTGNTPGFAGTNNSALPVTATVAVTPTANGCPGTPSSYTITINPGPNVLVPANITVCNGTNIPASNFTSTTPGATFAWTNSDASIGLAVSGTGNTPSFSSTNNSANPVTSTITVTPTANGCPGTPAFYTITVNPTPVVVVPADIVVCNGATIAASNFTSTTPGTTYAWTNSDASIGLVVSGTGNTPSFSGTNNTALPVTAIVAVTPTANGCSGVPVSYTITVNPIPVVVVPANVIVCNGANVAAGVFTSTTPGTTFAWTNSTPSIGLAASGTGNTPSFSGTNNTANPITATVTVTPTANGCPGTPISYTITVNPTPVVVVPANVTVCNGANVAAGVFTSTTPGTTFAWTNSTPSIGLAASGTGNTPSFTGTNNTANPVTATVTVTPSANGCPGTPVSYTITVNPTPVVVVPANIIVCNATTVAVFNFTSSTPGTTFAWTNSNSTIGLAASGTGNTPSFTGTNNTANPVTATVTVTPTANGCPGAPVSYTITVNPTPVVVVPTNITVCNGANVAAGVFSSTTPGTTFAWTNSTPSIGLAASGTGNTSSFSSTNNSANPVTSTITVTPTANGCPGVPVSYNITVNPTPVVVVPADIVVCNGAAVSAGVFTSTTPGTTFAWTNSNPSIGLAVSGTGDAPSFTGTNNTALPVTVTVTVTPTANACPGVPVTYNITVNPTPAVVVPADIVVCNGVIITASNFTSTTPGTTFDWINSDASIGLAANGTGDVPSFTGTNNSALPITATITVTPTANNCPGIPVLYYITINPSPVVVVPADIVVCNGVTIAASNFTSTTPGTTYAWTNSDASIGLVVSGTGNTPSFSGTNNTALPVTAIVAVTPTANGCSGVPVSYTITVNPIPVVVVPANVIVCNGANVAAGVFTSTTPGTTFVWTNSNTTIGLAGSGTGNTPSFTAINNTAIPVTSTITVTPTANGCPGTPVSYTITVNPTPVVVVQTNITVCNGANVAAGVFTSTTPGTTFAWTNSTPSIGLAASGTGNTPSFTGTNNTANPVTATVTVTPTANGCQGTPVSYTITVNPTPVVVVPANVTVCNGANVAAGVFTSTTPGTTFAWTNSNSTIGLAASGTGNTPSFTGTNNTANPVTATVTVTPTANGCPGAPVSYTITVNPTPVVVVPANVTACNGANVATGVFSSTTPGTTFAWTNSTPSIGLAASGTGNAPSFTGTNNTANPVTVTVTVTPTANGCPGVPIAYNITVNPTPAVVVPADIVVCNAVTIAASNFTSTTPGSTFDWTNSDASIGLAASGTGNTPSFSSTNNSANPVTSTITVTPTANGCPGTPAFYTITVNPTPVVVVPADIVVCNGATIAASNFTSTTPGTTYAWTNSNPSIGLAASGTGDAPSFTGTNNTALPVTVTVTVTPTANGCPGVPITYNITVNPTPAVVVPADIVVCNAVTIAASNFTSTTPGSTFDWTNSDASIGLAASGTGNTPSFSSTNNSANPVTSTITVTPTANGCPGTPASYTITVNPTPVVVVPANVTACNGANVATGVFSSTTPGTTFAWANTNTTIGLAASGTGNTPSFTGTNNTANPVTATVTVTPTANGCPGTPVSYTITVNPTPVVVVPANIIVCNATTVAVSNFTSSTPGTTFAWTNSNSTIGLAASGTENTPSFTGTNNTANPVTATVTVTPTANVCPGVPVTYNITVNPTPAVVVPSDIVICNGENIVVTNFTSTTQGTTFSWTNSDATIGLAASGTGNTPSFTGTNNTALPVTATVTVTPTANSCPGVPVSYNITVNPTPVVVVPADIVVCNGAAVSAGVFTSTTPGTTFAWTNSNPSIGLAASGTGDAPSFTGTNNTALPVTVTVTVTPTANGCPGVPITYNITVNPTPAVVVPADIVVCNAVTIAASNFTSTTPGATFSWTNSDASIGLAANGTGDVLSFTGTNNSALPITATITVTPTANNCPGIPVLYYITINPTPVVVLPASITACNASTVSPSAFTSTTPGTTFTWINSDPSIGLAASGTGNLPSFTATNNTVLPVTATITVTPTANGCVGIPVSLTIKVNPGPNVLIPADTLVCNGIIIPASNFTSTTPGTTFAWTNSDASIGLDASGTGNTPSFNATNNTTLPVTATVTVNPTANGCPGTSASYTITVNPTPVVVVTPSAASFCDGGFSNLVATGADNYLWSPTTGLSNTTSDTVTASPNTTTTYTVTGNYYGCERDTTVIITVFPNPVVAFQASDTAGCKPLCVDFSNQTTIASGTITNWFWDFGDGNSSTTSNPNHCYSDTGNYTVSLLAVSDQQCSIKFIHENYISVFPLPEAEFSFSPDNVMLVDPTFQFHDESYGAVEWYWSFGDGESLSNLVANPEHTYPDTGAGTYWATLLIVNRFGCIDSVTHELPVNPIFTLYIPNAFTPNNDRDNDIFYAYGEGILTFKMMIFDRWGMHLFTSGDLFYGWNGSFRDALVQNDVYVYRVEYTGVNNNAGTRIGIVTVVK